jgi:hypothetical protein
MNEYNKVGYSCNSSAEQIGHCSTCQPGSYLGWFYNLPYDLLPYRAEVEKNVFYLCREYKIPDDAKSEEMLFMAAAIITQKTESVIKNKGKRTIKNANISASRRHTQELFYTLHPKEDSRISASRNILKNHESFAALGITIVSKIIAYIIITVMTNLNFCNILV